MLKVPDETASPSGGPLLVLKVPDETASPGGGPLLVLKVLDETANPGWGTGQPGNRAEKSIRVGLG